MFPVFVSYLIMNCPSLTNCVKRRHSADYMFYPSSDAVWSQQGVKQTAEEKKVSKSWCVVTAGISISRRLSYSAPWNLSAFLMLAVGIRQMQKLLAMLQCIKVQNSEEVNTVATHTGCLRCILSGCFSFSKQLITSSSWHGVLIACHQIALIIRV